MTTTEHRKLTEPLESVTAIFGMLLLVALAAGVLFSIAGSGSFGGFGHAAVCATQPNTGYGGSGWTQNAVATRPGATISINGTLQACAPHPAIAQRVLYTLTSLPGMLVWGGVLLLLWRIIRAGRTAGPFTLQAAAAMRRLGWFIIVGSVLAAALQGFALDQLLNTMLTPGGDFGDVIIAPIHALLPGPALAGAALLTFARIIRLGAAMDDEIKGTV